MQIKKLIVGSLEENCYIIEKDNACLIIDPGDNAKKIKENITKDVKGILLTHNHFDHTGALQEIKEYYHIDINKTFPPFNYEIIDTKGHTDDSKTFYFPEEKIMFTGDFLFKNSIGRTKLLTENKNINKKENKEDKTMEITVKGMMCAHCEAHVKEALEKLTGVDEAVANHDENLVTLKTSADVAESDIKAAVEAAGYEYVGIVCKSVALNSFKGNNCCKKEKITNYILLHYLLQ